jgi:hypothetical protein
MTPPFAEALAFQEAAGTCRQPLFLPQLEFAMRVPLLFAAALALSACGNNDQTDNTQNVDENLTAENIVSNDVTAIDAVTGDAANMAADVDLNYGNLDENGAAVPSNEPQKVSTPAPKSPRERTLSPAPEPQTTTAANSVTNAQ